MKLLILNFGQDLKQLSRKLNINVSNNFNREIYINIFKKTVFDAFANYDRDIKFLFTFDIWLIC